MIQLFREKLSKKKHQSGRDKTERWSGHSMEFCILASVEEMYEYVFLHMKNLFFLAGGLYL